VATIQVQEQQRVLVSSHNANTGSNDNAQSKTQPTSSVHTGSSGLNLVA